MFVTVLRASAAVRVAPGTQVSMNVVDKGQSWQVTFRTRYVDFAEQQQLPRELWVEVVGPGEDLDDAMRSAQGRANVMASVLTCGMNAAVDPLQVDVCFDASPEREEHDFFQNCLLDETGMPRVARVVQVESCLAFMKSVTASVYRTQLLRAVAQYELALRNWLPG